MIQLITHYTDTVSYLDSVRIALAGGCRWVQLRMKHVTREERRELALQALPLCREAGATCIIDDDVDLVKEVRADGVHLGLNDMPIDEARQMLGKEFLIGGTANTLADVERHYRNGADYIGCGPFRFTTTKERLSPVLGLEGYRTIVTGMREKGIRIPIVAIGGITFDDIPSLMETGVTGVALSGTVLRAADPVEEMARMVSLLAQYK